MAVPEHKPEFLQWDLYKVSRDVKGWRDISTEDQTRTEIEANKGPVYQFGIG